MMKLSGADAVWLLTLAVSAFLLQYFWSGFLDIECARRKAGNYLLGLIYLGLSVLWHISGLSPAPQGLRGAFLVFLLVVLFGTSCLLFPGYVYNNLYLSITFVCINQLCYLLAYSLSNVATGFAFSSLEVRAPGGPFGGTLKGEIFMFLFMAMITLFQYLSFRKLRSGVVYKNLVFQRYELPLLVYPGLSGLLLGVLLREVTSFVARDGRVYHLMALAPVFNLLLPLVLLATLYAVLTTNGLLQRMRQMYEEKSENVILHKQLLQMQEHIIELERLYSGVRSMKHDMRKHLSNLQALLQNAAPVTDRAFDEYLGCMEETLEELECRFQTGNPVTDVILNSKYREAQKEGILYRSSFLFPGTFGFSAFDIGIILDNALDNALEACRKLRRKGPHREAFIWISSFVKDNMFLIKIENSYDGAYLVMGESGLPLTTKQDRKSHGIGLRNIRKCARKYFGDVECSGREERFTLIVMLQRREGTQGENKS